MPFKWKSYIWPVIISLGVGGLAALLAGDMAGVYEGLEKPSFSPPAIVFPIVWTVLYILMGIGAGAIAASESPDSKAALQAFAMQLAANFIWPFLFFRFSFYWAAFVWLLVLIVLVAVMAVRFYRIIPCAGLLQIPYLLWLLFAGYLNLSVALQNT